jgi:hypothetical protein
MRSSYFENPGSHPSVELILDDGPVKSKDYPLSTHIFFQKVPPPLVGTFRYTHLVHYANYNVRFPTGWSGSLELK